MTTLTPTLVWAQRVNKVFVTFEMLGTSNVKVSLTDGLLSLDADAAGKSYKLENMPLWAEIDSEGSKWFSNDRAVVITLKKKEEEWWDGLTKDKGLKRFIKVDFSKWCEEDDKEYTGEVAMGGGFDDMGGMGGMGGMDFSSMMGGMGGMGMGDAAGMPGADFDDEDDDEPLDDLEPKDLPPIGGEEDGPPPLEEVD